MLPNITQQSSYAIGWRTLALMNAGLAQSENRGDIAWFLVSCLLGPIDEEGQIRQKRDSGASIERNDGDLAAKTSRDSS
jgi:hypothetical protein